MADIYSKRQKNLRGDNPDVYTYDEIPQPLRAQINFIIDDVAKSSCLHIHITDRGRCSERFIQMLVEQLRREYGEYSLIRKKNSASRIAARHELQQFVDLEDDVERVLDTIELAFRNAVELNVSSAGREDNFKALDSLATEMNRRFKEHGVGYQLQDCMIVRVDSEYVHAYAIKPVIKLLGDPDYAGAEHEFLAAHEHYRHGRFKETLVESNKAFESTIKIICGKRGWPIDSNATSARLVEACFSNGLLVGFHDQHLANLRALLTSCVPTIRNKAGGHGQGADVVPVPSHLASFVLHATASAILLLIESEKALP